MKSKSRKEDKESRYQNSWARGKRNFCEEGEGGAQDAYCTPNAGDPVMLEQAKVEIIEYLIEINVLEIDLDNWDEIRSKYMEN